MKSLLFVLFSLAAVFASTSEFTLDEGVYVLTKDNFEKATNEFEFALIEFYAPWCGHCQRLAPEYAQAAQKLAESNPEIKLCKVNAEDETDLGEKFNIQGFPTIKFFVKNSEPIDYTGGRTSQEIINWLKKRTGSPTTEVNTVEDAQKFISEKDVVAFFFGPTTSQSFEEFVKVARSFDDVEFINSNSDEVKQKYEAKEGTLILLTDKGEEKVEFTGDFDAENVGIWVEKNRFPLVMPFNQAAAQRIFGEELDAIFLIKADNDAGNKAAEAFKQAAKELKDAAVVFSLAGIEEDFGGKLAEFIGVEEEHLPAIRIVQPHQNLRKFLFTAEPTVENIKTFINDFLNKNLKPFFRSQEIPAESHENNVRIVVANNFEEVILDKTKDVLIEFYAPWCGHCQHLTPIYESVATRLKENSNLVIAKMDATANEVESVLIEGFPTIRFYPSNNKDSPLDYEGERTERAFVSFIKQHATVTINDTKVDSDVDEPTESTEAAEPVEPEPTETQDEPNQKPKDIDL